MVNKFGMDDDVGDPHPEQYFITISIRGFCSHYDWFLQRVRIARNAGRCNSQRDFVRTSVCPAHSGVL